MYSAKSLKIHFEGKFFVVEIYLNQEHGLGIEAFFSRIQCMVDLNANGLRLLMIIYRFEQYVVRS